MEKNKDEVKRITTKQHGLGRKRGNEKKKEKQTDANHIIKEIKQIIK